MAAVLLRRSVAAATLATIATALVPTAVSVAAPSAFAASSITTDPAPDNGVVPANRPKVVATFNDTPASGSIKLVVQGTSTNLCGTPVIDAQKHQVTCQPGSDLDTTKTYEATGTATDSAGHTAKTSTLTFTVDYPVIDPANSNPVPNGTIADGGEDLTAAFDEPITGNDASTFAPDGAFKLYEINADGGRGLQLGGTITFNGNPIQGSDSTVTFDPAANLSNGRYEAILLVYGVKSDGTTKNDKAIGRADYSVFVNNTAPFNLSSPPFANTANNTAFPFSGNAAPGLTINVTVEDPKDPNPLTNTYTGSGTVDPCASAPSCPWTVEVDISDITDPQNGVTWTAQGEDANGKTTQTGTGPAFNVDYSAPPTPDTNPDPTITNDTTNHTAQVLVNAQETGTTDVVSYKVTITDPEGNKLEPTFPSQNQNLPSTPIDVSTLDDGQLSILIQAVDSVGNVSDPQNPPFHVTKNAGLAPNLGTSILTSDNGDTTFVEAESQSVPSPTKVTVGFTQTIKLSYTDNTTLPPATHGPQLCIASQNGNCIVSPTPTLSQDKHAMSINVPSKLADATYEVRVHAYSAGACPDKTPANMNSWSCEQYNDLVRESNGQPFQFTVDSTKPTIEITQVTNPVTAQNQKNVSIAGTVDKNVDTVQLIVTSSGSATQKLLINNVTITQPSDPSATQATWSAAPLDFSSLPDGRLTIKATAKKSNGLSGTDTAHAKMQAHLSVLTEATDRRKVTFGHVIHISGRLTDEAGAAIGTATVSVRPRFASGRFGKAAADVTDANGNYSVTFKPRHNATYYARYDGSPQHDGVKTHTARTLVRWKVTIGSPNPGSHESSPVTISGKVGPNHKGALVTIYRHTAGGNTVLGKARLDKQSHFSTKVVLPAGKNTVFAKVKKTSSNLAGKSGLLRFRVG